MLESIEMSFARPRASKDGLDRNVHGRSLSLNSIDHESSDAVKLKQLRDEMV